MPSTMDYSSITASIETRRIALAGNPNAGKSTLFNALTGLRQHIGNWPGKTVEKKTGLIDRADLQVELTDLPGTYSLSAFSMEEIVARDFLVNERPDAIIAVVDASNLERNLYLIVQLLEIETPVVVALNMMDVVDRQGLAIDIDELGIALKSPVIPIVARRGTGLETVVEAAVQERPPLSDMFTLDYGPALEAEIDYLLSLPDGAANFADSFPPRWLAIKLLEGDVDVMEKIRRLPGGKALLTAAEDARSRLIVHLGEDVDTYIADWRYEWIHALVGRCIQKPAADMVSISDRIDRIATHRLIGIPLFLVAMWFVFKITIDISAPWVDWLDSVVSGPISRWALAILSLVGLGDSWVASLIVDGILAGVGAVLAFIPVLLALYFALALLEDSGYMARGAFVMDRLMSRIGLQGRSFLPLMVGFGCSVPAIYATRTLTNQRDRVLTGLLVPFMSCGARLPVYVLFAAIFFPRYASLVILGLYLLGIIVALGVGLLLQKTWLPQTAKHGLVMELPPYRLPNGRSIWYHMWQRTRSFLQHAASLILLTSMLIWLLMSIPLGGAGTFTDTPVEASAFGRLSAAIVPVIEPLGFGSWQAGGALISGLVAKEVVVSTLAQSFNIEQEAVTTETPATFLDELTGIISSFFSTLADTIRATPSLFGINLSEDEDEVIPTGLSLSVRDTFNASSGGHGALAGLAFMVFVLLYTPCMAAIAAERQELGTRWMWLSLFGQLALAWLLAFVVFQGGLWMMRLG